MKITSIPQFARNLNRATEVLAILSKYGLADWIHRLNIGVVKGIYRRTVNEQRAETTTEVRIRQALSELGTTFIKLGQVLSTRPDLVGLKLADELSKLQTDVPADATEDIRRIIEAELGHSIDELFGSFDDKPLASASIAQVHAATLKDGTPVVVKVRHPHIVERIRNDLDILSGLAELAEKYLAELRPYQPRGIVKEFERTIMRELDFGRELRNLDRFHQNFAKDPAVRIPKPYAELSTVKVLVMDRLEGLFIREAAANPETYDGVAIARQGARVFLEMIFRDGFYHADPHPGNILVLPGGVIGIIDVGMVGQITPQMREDLEDILLAIGSNNPESLIATLIRVCGPTPIPDPVAFAADVTDFLGYYQGVPLNKIDISTMLNEITEIVRRHHLILPTSIALLLRVFVVLEGTSRLLHPDFKLTEVIEPFQDRMVSQRLSPRRQIRRLRVVMSDWQDLIGKLPTHLRDMMLKVQTGRIEVQLQHHHLEPSVNRIVMGLITAALLLASSLLLGLKAPPTIYDVSVLGVLMMMSSMVTGALLVRAILRSHYLDG